ncbi:hypothetical protein POM88_018135 [Heracleum sosnowskyi]|uniref:Uncharacterized protein n=1 Tax=Heracleum sosnowskyi TaxID=360622 RepID=A0AAD8MYY9_9APIA|nr:hypothetical protein POM88_018135 [Heracleum sosnowskyi]
MDLLYDIVDHDLDQSTYENDGDDKFYAELERRILVLINTADEGDHSNNSRMMRPTTNNYSSHRDQTYFDWTETENPPSSVPSTILNLWRSNANGTGVFIPHMVKAKRRNKNRGRKVRTEREIYKAKAVANKN